MTFAMFFKNEIVMKRRRGFYNIHLISPHLTSSHLTSPFAGKAFKAGLSLGSGRGQFEHELVRIGVVRNILGVDISETRLSLPYVVNIVFFSTVTLLILIPVRIYTG